MQEVCTSYPKRVECLRPARPIVWSRSSVIYAAHPTQPTVTARHFPSSRQFIVPWPQPIASNPAVYDPPTVIAVNQAEDWLFAYSPGQGVDGVGCLWKRGDQLESWTVHEYFTYPKYTGVVAAEWISSERSVSCKPNNEQSPLNVTWHTSGRSVIMVHLSGYRCGDQLS